MNRKQIKEALEADQRLKLAAAPEGIEARAEATIVSLASLNAQRRNGVSLAAIDAAIDRYLEIATDRLMQESALTCLGLAELRHSATTVRSRFWNNVSGLISRRLLVVLQGGKALS